MGSMPYPALQSMFDAIYPPGLQWYWSRDFLGQIPDRAIDEHLKFGEQVPTLHSMMQLYPVDGAVSRVDRHETAFNYRDAYFEPLKGAKNTASREFGKRSFHRTRVLPGFWGSDGDGTKCRAQFSNAIKDSSEI